LPRQEKGVRRSCALPYELAVEGALARDGERVAIRFEARNERFGERSSGSPFNVFAFRKPGELTMRAYAVAAGAGLEDSWALRDFEGGRYHLVVQGPNGFMRELTGSREDPALEVRLEYPKESRGGAELRVVNRGKISVHLRLRDNSY